MTKDARLWGGRFAEAPHETFAEFNDSFRFDRRLFAADVQASVAHANGLSRAGVITQLEAEEMVGGLTSGARYASFRHQVDQLRQELTRMLRDLRAEGRRIAGYGAPAKATVLLNACGIGTDLLEFTVDRSPHKQGRLIPGVRVPIRPVEDLIRERPDVALLLPWNLTDEIVRQQADYLRQGGAFIVPVPTPRVIDAARTRRGDL